MKWTVVVGLAAFLMSVQIAGFVGWLLLVFGGLLLMGGTVAIFGKYRDPLSALAFYGEIGLYFLGILARSRVLETHPLIGWPIVAAFFGLCLWFLLLVWRKGKQESVR